MFRRFMLTGTVLLCLALLVIPVLAGGWAVITLDHLPRDVAAGEAVEIHFTVRQHGKTPVPGLAPSITFKHAESGALVEVIAGEGTQPGEYAASLELPSAGQWTWSIDAFGQPQSMPELTVRSAALNSATPVINTPVALLGLSGLALFGAAGWLLKRHNLRWAIALVVAGLAVTSVGLVSASAFDRDTNQATKSSLPSASEAQAALGRDLFIAKGCGTCHSNQRIPRAYRSFTTDVGPDLSAYQAAPEFLRLWLADPSSIKPETFMPDLRLSEAEIEALIAFLNVSQ